MADDRRRNPDDYPEDPYDYEAWIACPPPPEIGPAIADVLAEIASWTAEQRAARRAPGEDTTEFQNALDRVTDALDAHPIGQSPGCQEIFSVEPWLWPVSRVVSQSASAVVAAVAARDHGLITDADFATLTGWWTHAGLPMPDPISDADREKLIDWWIELGVLPAPSLR